MATVLDRVLTCRRQEQIPFPTVYKRFIIYRFHTGTRGLRNALNLS